MAWFWSCKTCDPPEVIEAVRLIEPGSSETAVECSGSWPKWVQQWLVGGLEHDFYFPICWEWSSQLTNICQRGWNHQLDDFEKTTWTEFSLTGGIVRPKRPLDYGGFGLVLQDGFFSCGCRSHQLSRGLCWGSQGQVLWMKNELLQALQGAGIISIWQTQVQPSFKPLLKNSRKYGAGELQEMRATTPLTRWQRIWWHFCARFSH